MAGSSPQHHLDSLGHRLGCRSGPAILAASFAVSGIEGTAKKAVRQMWKPWLAGLTRICPVLAMFALTGVTAQLRAETLVQADQVIVLKHERKLYLMRQGEALKWFRIALGRYPVGQKTERGDGRTPEGIYRILGRDATSDYYRALWLSYPNSADRERAKRLGVNPGGGIMIHAVPKGYEPTGPGEPMIDWTNGCIAVTNADMDEIWARAPDGTPVEIRP